jgi:hypothetical protein
LRKSGERQRPRKLLRNSRCKRNMTPPVRATPRETHASGRNVYNGRRTENERNCDETKKSPSISGARRPYPGGVTRRALVRGENAPRRRNSCHATQRECSRPRARARHRCRRVVHVEMRVHRWSAWVFQSIRRPHCNRARPRAEALDAPHRRSGPPFVAATQRSTPRGCVGFIQRSFSACYCAARDRYRESATIAPGTRS